MRSINKIIINNEVKLDLTSDTVTPESLLTGHTAHDRTGNVIVGTLSIGDVDSSIEQQLNSILGVTSMIGVEPKIALIKNEINRQKEIIDDITLELLAKAANEFDISEPELLAMLREELS